jgi:hypothetical protein
VKTVWRYGHSRDRHSHHYPQAGLPLTFQPFRCSAAGSRLLNTHKGIPPLQQPILEIGDIVNYDTLTLARALESTELTQTAADAIIAAINEAHAKLATKDELAAQERAHMHAIEKQTLELRADIAELRAEIANTGITQTRWIIGTMAAFLGIAVAIFKLF